MNLDMGPAFTRAQAIVNGLAAAIVKGGLVIFLGLLVARSVALPTPRGAEGG